MSSKPVKQDVIIDAMSDINYISQLEAKCARLEKENADLLIKLLLVENKVRHD